MSRLKLTTVSFVLVAGTVFALAEIGLRIYQKMASNIPMSTFLPGYKIKRFELSPFLVFGPRIDWQIPGKRHPEYAYFNSQGFRTQGLVGRKQPGEFRIITLGGSTTEDVWNDDGIHWPLVVEQHLQAQGQPKLRVLNSAMSAYTTAHSLIRLAFDVTEHEPDMVVVMHNINDLMVNYQAAADNRIVDPHYRVLYAAKRFTGDISDDDVIVSRAWHMVSSRWNAWRLGRNRPLVHGADIETGKRYFMRNLENLAALAKARNIQMVLLTMPYSRAARHYELARENERPYPPQPRLLEDLASYNEAIRQVGKKSGTPVIDMEKLLGSDEKYFVDIVHYSTEGVRAFGTTLAPHLRRAMRTNS